MPFRVTARTILQLGAELISSDAVAFYELIKNAFDAGSKRVTVRVIERVPSSEIPSIQEALSAVKDAQPRGKAVQEAVQTAQMIISDLAVRTAPDIDNFLVTVQSSCDWVDNPYPGDS